jgi:hypothetical protein
VKFSLNRLSDFHFIAAGFQREGRMAGYLGLDSLLFIQNKENRRIRKNSSVRITTRENPPHPQQAEIKLQALASEWVYPLDRRGQELLALA